MSEVVRERARPRPERASDVAFTAGGCVERDHEYARRNDAGTERGEAPAREPDVGEPQSEEAERREHHEHAAAVGTRGAQSASERSATPPSQGTPASAPAASIEGSRRVSALFVSP